MKFSHPNADIYLPETSDSAQLEPAAALARTTHLCVLAHPDDIEINAYPAVAECYDRPDRHLTGVIVNDGAGSAREGAFAHFTNDQMRATRIEEQRAAARLGRYNLQIQLSHPNTAAKDPHNADVQADLHAIFSGCRPQIVYLHQPLDKHDTHVATLLHCLKAIRALPPEARPKKIFGVEGWRGLEWILDADKVALDASGHPELKLPLIQVFASQVAGGKRYDEAALGRHRSNATFYEPLATDSFTELAWALDLTPLVQDGAPSLKDYSLGIIDRVRTEVQDRLTRLGAV